MSIHGKRWLIDLGNSRVKCAVLDERGVRGEMFAIGYEQPDAAATLLRQMEQGATDDQAWLASVASAARTQAVTQALHDAGIRVHRIQTQARCGKLRIAYPEPAQLGVDRFLALLAASERNDGPWLIVSAGSALTVDLLAADGMHVGGLIAPMPGHMRAALAQNFSQLDVPEGSARDFADNTADAIASAANMAVVGLVERALRKSRDRVGAIPTLLLVGGNAGLLADIEHPRIVPLPSLILDGMARYVLGMDN